MRLMRMLGRGTVLVLGIAVIAVGAAYALSSQKLSVRAAPPVRKALAVASDSATLVRGQRLAVINGCTDCHGESLSGKVMADAPVFGRLVASNLTSGIGGVMTQYDVQRLDAAIRDGMGADGRKLVIMPSSEYSGLADADVAAIIAFLRSRPPVNNVLPPMAFGPIARALLATGKLPLQYDLIDHQRTTLAVAPTGGTVEQGRYLAAGCTGCHGPDLAGGEVPGAPAGTPPSPNITTGGAIGRWSQADFVKAIRSGVRPDGSTLQNTMPWRAFSRLTDEELQGLYLYLRTVTPSAPSGA
jgi:mono/diheme cytochrome c family protein